MYHIPQVLGLYHARADGIELGDPLGNAQEAETAIVMHQEPDGIEFFPRGDRIKADLGGKWTFLPTGELIGLLERLKDATK